MQGLQCFVDDHTGFGQFASDVLADLQEDYSTAPALVCQVQGPQGKDADAV